MRHLESMQGTQRLSGSRNPLSSAIKLFVALGALTVGLFVFAVSATFLLFAVLAVAVIGLIATSIFWARARLTGRPFGPREQLEAIFRQIEAQAVSVRHTAHGDGPVLDAHQTPDGWSVER